MKMKRRILYISISAFILIAVFIRIQGINRTLWGDEAVSATMMMTSWEGFYNLFTRNETHPPLYFLSSWLITRITGHPVEVIRIVSLIGSVIALLFMAMWAIQRYRHTAFIFLLLIIFSPVLIMYGHEGRNYGWLCALTALLIFFADTDVSSCRICSAKYRKILFITASISIVLTHYIGWLYLVPVLIYMCLTRDKSDDIRLASAAFFSAVIAGSSWALMTSYIRISKISEQLSLHFKENFDGIATMESLKGLLTSIFFWPEVKPELAALMIPIVLMINAMLIYYSRRKWRTESEDDNNRLGRLLLLFFLIAGFQVLFYGVMIFLSSFTIRPRYFLPLIPVYLMIVSIRIYYAKNLYRYAILAVLISMQLWAGVFLKTAYFNYDHQKITCEIYKGNYSKVVCVPRDLIFRAYKHEIPSIEILEFNHGTMQFDKNVGSYFLGKDTRLADKGPFWYYYEESSRDGYEIHRDIYRVLKTRYKLMKEIIMPTGTRRLLALFSDESPIVSKVLEIKGELNSSLLLDKLMGQPYMAVNDIKEKMNKSESGIWTASKVVELNNYKKSGNEKENSKAYTGYTNKIGDYDFFLSMTAEDVTVHINELESIREGDAISYSHNLRLYELPVIRKILEYLIVALFIAEILTMVIILRSIIRWSSSGPYS